MLDWLRLHRRRRLLVSNIAVLKRLLLLLLMMLHEVHAEVLLLDSRSDTEEALLNYVRRYNVSARRVRLHVVFHLGFALLSEQLILL